MKRLIELGGGLAATFALSAMMGFIMVNVMLGCETWDASYWTVTNSCVTPSAIWNNLFN